MYFKPYQIMIKKSGAIAEFDFFLDEDVRSQRIGLLCLSKQLTPALGQALFRVREEQYCFYQKKLEGDVALSDYEKGKKFSEIKKQMREVKWSNLNIIRAYIAKGFLEQFFHYWGKGPLPVMFFNAPFTDDHLTSVNQFFDLLVEKKVKPLSNINYSESILFMDSHNTPAGYKLEENIRNTNNLSRCYRIDSRASDLIQLADLLLGITVSLGEKKHTNNKGKLLVVHTFKHLKETYKQKFSENYEGIITF